MTGKVLSSDIGVHATHCCYRHGCKYGAEHCPVTLGHVAAKYPCEYCDSREGKMEILAERLAKGIGEGPGQYELEPYLEEVEQLVGLILSDDPY